MNNTYIITVIDNLTGKTTEYLESDDYEFAKMAFKWHINNRILTEGEYNLTISLISDAKVLRTVNIEGKE